MLPRTSFTWNQRRLWSDFDAFVIALVIASWTPTVDELVPAVVRRRPDRAPQPFLQPLVVRAHHLGTDVDPREFARVHRAQTVHHVRDLALEHEDDRVVAEVRVRPVEHEEVREPRD